MQEMVVNTETTTERSVENEGLLLYMDVFITSSPEGSGIYTEEEMERWQEPGVVDDPKETASQTQHRADVCMSSEPVKVCTRPTQAQARQSPSMEKQGWTWSPILSQEPASNS